MGNNPGRHHFWKWIIKKRDWNLPNCMLTRPKAAETPGWQNASALSSQTHNWSIRAQQCPYWETWRLHYSMIWGCFAASASENLQCVQGTVTSQAYQGIWREMCCPVSVAGHRVLTGQWAKFCSWPLWVCLWITEENQQYCPCVYIIKHQYSVVNISFR